LSEPGIDSAMVAIRTIGDSSTPVTSGLSGVTGHLSMRGLVCFGRVS
jgi:hypothetical protein